MTKRQPTVGARSMTQCFLKYLANEIPCNFHAHNVRDIGQQYQSLDEIGITHLSEVDCKDQLNKIPPDTHETRIGVDNEAAPLEGKGSGVVNPQRTQTAQQSKARGFREILVHAT